MDLHGIHSVLLSLPREYARLVGDRLHLEKTKPRGQRGIGLQTSEYHVQDAPHCYVADGKG